MGKRGEAAEELRERLMAAMLADIGISEKMAQPFVESVMDCFAGEQLYFPARSRMRVYPIEEMREALLAGTPVKKVLRTFEVSRSKLHSLFPGGLPKPAATVRSSRP